MLTVYEDGAGTYRKGDRVVYDGRVATVEDIVTVGGEPRIEITTDRGSTIRTTPGLDPRWGGPAPSKEDADINNLPRGWGRDPDDQDVTS